MDDPGGCTVATGHPRAHHTVGQQLFQPPCKAAWDCGAACPFPPLLPPEGKWGEGEGEHWSWGTSLSHERILWLLC